MLKAEAAREVDDIATSPHLSSCHRTEVSLDLLSLWSPGSHVFYERVPQLWPLT